MAAAAENRNSAGIFWINDTSEEEQSVVFIPGVSKKMSLKCVSSGEGKVRVRAASGSEVKSGRKSDLSVSHPAADTPVPKTSLQNSSTFSAKARTPTQVSDTPVPQTRSKASLKDLCPEDKRRIANLIEELARVSEEKEESVQRLRDEQETFEKKIQQLEQQNTLIIQERESLQQQYRECQELLGLYQQYLSQQQEKLNKSIAELNLSHSHCKMVSSERAKSRPGVGRGLDGSYLDFPANGARPGGSGSVGCAHSFLGGHCNAPPSHSEQDISRHIVNPTCAQKCPEVIRSDPGADKREHLARNALAPCGSTVPRASASENRNRTSVELTRTAPPLGREDWTEKRQHLLFQKKQLELERERLQVRLAQQEERLIKQNQELHQSRMDYNKFQQAATAELQQSFNENRQPGVSVDPLSERREESMRKPVNDVHLQKSNGTVQPPEPVVSHEHSTIMKKDVATSPVHSHSFRKSDPPVLPLSMPKTPEVARLDSSVMELLDMFSPVLKPERSRVSPGAQRSLSRVSPGAHRSLSRGLPQHRSLFSPPGLSQASLQELEESQILEEIFFIC